MRDMETKVDLLTGSAHVVCALAHLWPAVLIDDVHVLAQMAQLVDDSTCIASHIAEMEACNSELKQQISICKAMQRDAVASNEHLSKTLKLLETRLLVTVKHLCSCLSLAEGTFDTSKTVHMVSWQAIIYCVPVVQIVSSICCSELTCSCSFSFSSASVQNLLY